MHTILPARGRRHFDLSPSRVGVNYRARVIGAALACASCYDVLDAFDYRVQPQPAGSLYAPACMACLEQSCRPELDGCLADAECSALFETVQRCVDPGCWIAAAAPFGSLSVGPQTLWPLGKRLSGNDRSLDECTRDVCGAACRIGSNFECAGRYEWRHLRKAGGMDMRVGVWHIGLPVVGARVRACHQFGCANSYVEGMTDESASVTLRVPANEMGFEGFFVAEPPEPLLPSEWHRSYPFLALAAPGDIPAHTIELVSRADAETITQDLLGHPYDPTRANIAIRLQDCHLWDRKGASFDLTMNPPDAGKLVRDPPIANGWLWGALALSLPAGEPVTLTAVTRDTGKMIVRFKLAPPGGAATILELLPVTASDATD